MIAAAASSREWPSWSPIALALATIALGLWQSARPLTSQIQADMNRLRHEGSSRYARIRLPQRLWDRSPIMDGLSILFRRALC